MPVEENASPLDPPLALSDAQRHNNPPELIRQVGHGHEWLLGSPTLTSRREKVSLSISLYYCVVYSSIRPVNAASVAIESVVRGA